MPIFGDLAEGKLTHFDAGDGRQTHAGHVDCFGKLSQNASGSNGDGNISLIGAAVLMCRESRPAGCFCHQWSRQYLYLPETLSGQNSCALDDPRIIADGTKENNLMCNSAARANSSDCAPSQM